MIDYIKKETNKALAGGAHIESQFNGVIKDDTFYGFYEGDVFTIPTDFNVITDCGMPGAQYIFVLTKSGRVCKFYPSMFTRKVTEANEDGTMSNRVHRTIGSATEMFKQYSTVNDGMNALRGKVIRVTEIGDIRTQSFGRIHSKKVYQFDLV